MYLQKAKNIRLKFKKL